MRPQVTGLAGWKRGREPRAGARPAKGSDHSAGECAATRIVAVIAEVSESVARRARPCSPRIAARPAAESRPSLPPARREFPYRGSPCPPAHAGERRRGCAGGPSPVQALVGVRLHLGPAAARHPSHTRAPALALAAHDPEQADARDTAPPGYPLHAAPTASPTPTPSAILSSTPTLIDADTTPVSARAYPR